jgi:hypothetical protein
MNGFVSLFTCMVGPCLFAPMFGYTLAGAPWRAHIQ